MRNLLFSIAVIGALAATAAKLDGIAARVDSNVITVGDVMNEIRRNPDAGRRMMGADESEMQALYGAALDTLVERRLILKAAAEKKAAADRAAKVQSPGEKNGEHKKPHYRHRRYRHRGKGGSSQGE